MRRVPLRNLELTLGADVELPAGPARYLRDVLRLPIGERVEVFDGRGAAFEAELISHEPCVLRLLEAADAFDGESPCSITLYQAIPKQDRFEWIVEKTTELGVQRIVPIETQRSVVRIPEAKVAKRIARWQKIADEAARQSGRGISPEIAPVVSLRNAMRDATHDVQLVLHPREGEPLSRVVPADACDVAVWIGPEGGFSDDELTELDELCVRCSVGPRILRSETAGVAVVTAVQLLTGGLE